MGADELCLGCSGRRLVSSMAPGVRHPGQPLSWWQGLSLAHVAAILATACVGLRPGNAVVALLATGALMWDVRGLFGCRLLLSLMH